MNVAKWRTRQAAEEPECAVSQITEILYEIFSMVFVAQTGIEKTAPNIELIRTVDNN